MWLRTKHLLNVFVIVAICMMALSCEKDQPECKGNCVSVRIRGRVYDKTTGVAFKNMPVDVKWTSARIGSNRYKVVEGTTDNNGVFDFTKTIDSTFFKDYKLNISIPTDTNYIQASYNYDAQYRQRFVYSLDVNELQQIQFELYPKTYLKIRLHRMQNDVFSYFSLGALFTDNFFTGNHTILGQQNAKDTTLIFKTATNIYTKVLYEKKLNGIQTSSKTDSILCTQTGANVIDINY